MDGIVPDEVEGNFVGIKFCQEWLLYHYINLL